MDTLVSLAQVTFIEAFADTNTEENMNSYLADSFNDGKLAAELNNADSSFFIAWCDGKPIGYLKLNVGTAQTEPQGREALEIERIYVRRSWLGKDIGRSLMEKALEVARVAEKEYVWLGVWEHNDRALRFYEKNGFIPFGKHIFRMGTDDQTDILMKKIRIKQYFWGEGKKVVVLHQKR